LRHVLLASLVGAGVAHLVRHFSGWHRARRHKDTLRDEALDETFPASDPPASQNFDTPRNRL